MFNAKNNAETTLAQSLGLSDTVAYFFDGSKLPSEDFLITVEDEIIFVKTNINDVGYNLIRGCENTAPAQHASGTKVECLFTAGMYDNLRFYIDQGESPDYAGIKYRLVVIDGEAFMEVVDNG